MSAAALRAGIAAALWLLAFAILGDSRKEPVMDEAMEILRSASHAPK